MLRLRGKIRSASKLDTFTVVFENAASIAPAEAPTRPRSVRTRSVRRMFLRVVLIAWSSCRRGAPDPAELEEREQARGDDQEGEAAEAAAEPVRRVAELRDAV